MLAAVAMGLGLVGAATVGHFMVLRLTAGYLATARPSPVVKMTVAVYTAIAGHIAGAMAYAAAFWFAEDRLGIGSFAKTDGMTAMDYFYFSLINMTTLGLGPMYPTGHLRFLAGIESLGGFMLISCSASFILLAAKSGRSEDFEEIQTDGGSSKTEGHPDG